MTDALADLLTRARDSGVNVWVDSGELRYRCRGNAVPRALLNELGSHRAALLRHLCDAGSMPAANELIPTFVPAARGPGRVPSFRHATLSALKDKLSGVDSMNCRFVVRVRGYIDLAAMTFAFEEIRRRHEVLKATVTEVEGRPWLVYGTHDDWKVTLRDVRHLPAHEREAAARTTVSELVWQPMDLSNGPLFRAFAINVDAEDCVLGFVAHHFISDMFSIQLLSEDLIRCYSFKAAGHDPPQTQSTLQYRDYLLGAAQWIEQPPIRTRLREWVDRLADAEPMDLIHRPPRAPTPDFSCAKYQFEIDAEMSAAIGISARQLRVSKFVLLLTVQKLLLASLTSQNRVTMGAVISGRELPMLAPVVGYLSDRLHWNTELDGDPDFIESVARVNRNYLEVMRHQFFRSDMVREELARRGKSLHAPVFNFVPYSREQAPATNSRFSKFQLDPAPFSTIPLPGISYWMSISEMPQVMRGDVRFPHGSSEQLVRQFLQTLEMAMKDGTTRLSAVRRALSSS